MAEKLREREEQEEKAPKKPSARNIVEDLSLSIVTPFSAKVGYDITTITGVLDTPHWGRIQWGTATTVYTSGLLFPTFTVPEFDSGGVLRYRMSFVLRGLQQAANQTYFAQVVFDDTSVSAEVTWTQPGVNANANDEVYFFDRTDSVFAAVSELATKASRQGWLDADEWREFRNLVIQTTINRVKWVDGR